LLDEDPMTLPAAPPRNFNFAEHLLEVGAAHAQRVAYIDDRGELSYRELAERVRRMASTLLALGVRREERVLLLMHDSCDWPVAFLGALYAGVVPVAVNTLLGADDYACLLAHSRAQAALVSSALVPVLEAALARGKHELRGVLVAGGEALPRGMEPLASALAAHAPLESSVATLADEPAFWLYSSGSTGRAKATVHAHASPYWTAELYGKRVLGLRAGDLCFSAAKLFFAYGLGNSLSFPLSAGATAVVTSERPTPELIFARWRGDTPALAGRKPTLFFGAPTSYAALLAAPDAPPRERIALRLCSSAGEALPREVGERFAARFGCDVLDGIGSTELLHIFLSNAPGDTRYGTSGRPVPGYEVALRREDGAFAADGEIAELFVRGPSAALAYWGEREKSRATFQGEWTRTGDKYVRDADGRYTYCGRSDDLFKVSGQFVSPFEVEARLVEHAAVLEAAVVARADEVGLLCGCAFVVLKPGANASDTLAGELRAFVRERLAGFKVPRSVHFVAELPKTATGKIQRFRLRAEAGRSA
jgi:benzoate-CoA ligase